LALKRNRIGTPEWVNSFMSEKKNIVIKVKYPSTSNSPSKNSSRPGVITEWNFKRIGVAVGSLLLVLISLFYFTDSGNQQADTNTSKLELPAQLPESKPQPVEQARVAEQSVVDPKRVIARAQLTSDIENNEPIDNLKLPLKIGNNETLWIYFFVELKEMKGKTIYHEWWLNGNLVSRKKVNISDDPWRTASKQLITYTVNNDWVVRLVDESRNKLTEKSFNLELK
jgi:Protein of unknown function (DUF2914)